LNIEEEIKIYKKKINEVSKEIAKTLTDLDQLKRQYIEYTKQLFFLEESDK